MGSGKLLNLAIKKHGVENFRKHIVKMCETSEEAFELEHQIVNEQFVADENTYNLVEGGSGGNWSSIGLEGSRRGGSISLKKRWADNTWRSARSLESSERLRRRHVEGKVSVRTFLGKTHSEETKRRIGAANAIHQKGENNSQAGTVWVFNTALKTSKQIHHSLINEYLLSGWTKGRNMKFD